MTDDPPPVLARHAQRVQAILALFRGEPVVAVAAQYRIGRSDLYKFRRRALTAIYQALAEQRRGPRRAHNRLAADREAQVVALCQRYPAWSSYQMRTRGGQEAPSPRTIQRVRKRNGLARFSKRAPALRPGCRLTPEARQRVATLIAEKPYLGPERTAWDLQNGEHLTVSPSTIKRLKRQRRKALLPPRPPAPAWRFYERRHPHSLWHGDFMEKIRVSV